MVPILGMVSTHKPPYVRVDDVKGTSTTQIQRHHLSPTTAARLCCSSWLVSSPRLPSRPPLILGTVEGNGSTDGSNDSDTGTRHIEKDYSCHHFSSARDPFAITAVTSLSTALSIATSHADWLYSDILIATPTSTP
jgi:hypothetical protein